VLDGTSGCPPVTVAVSVAEEPLQIVWDGRFTERESLYLMVIEVVVKLVVPQVTVDAVITNVLSGPGDADGSACIVMGVVCICPAGMISWAGKGLGRISACVAVPEASMARLITTSDTLACVIP